jgi:NAD(P)-dependent dehydrogenase (short-subunit alcohol dehydrogenase family)
VKRAVVTGASRGIGRAIALRLAGAGFEVIGTSRGPARAAADVGRDGVRFLPLDLGDEESIRAFAAAAGEVDVLVNNAGGSQVGALEEVPLARMRALFEANLFGGLRLTQLLLPSMRARRSGLIVNVASFAGVSPVPFISVYGASKAALIAASRGLRAEVAPWGIRVAVVAPFDIRTGIPLEECSPDGSAYAAPVRRVREARDRFLAEAPDPRIVADEVLRIARARRPSFFHAVGRGGKLTALLVRLLPDPVVERVVRKRFGLGVGPGRTADVALPQAQHERET